MRADEGNKIKEAHATGRPILQVATTCVSPAMVEMMGYAGAESVFIDMEHEPIDWETLENLVRACDCAGMVPYVRVNKQYPGYPSNIRKVLEAGAGWVQVPHINTKQEAEAVVRAAKFSPRVTYGTWPADQLRGSAGGDRAARYGMIPRTQYASLADQNTIVGVNIEEERGLRNMEAILSVEGIDHAHLATGDYSNSIGLPGQEDHPRVVAARKKVEAAVKARGMITRTRISWRDVLTDPERAKEEIKADIRDGFLVFNMGGEMAIIRECIQRCRSALDEAYREVQEEAAQRPS